MTVRHFHPPAGEADLLRLTGHLLDPTPEWHELAACAEVDIDLFFPIKGANAAAALKICAGCDVRARCLSDALARGEQFGVRGGMTPRERRRYLARDTAGAA